MTAEIFIISGFLGTGKTTFIQNVMLKLFNNRKIVLIVNDFGEAKIDSMIMSEHGLHVRAINAGCICCNLAGDFQDELQFVLRDLQPEVVIIEPSGVSRLSDLLLACTTVSDDVNVTLGGAVCVVDAKRCLMQYDNFGAFFEDQIIHADVVVMSHLDEVSAAEREQCRQLVQRLNPQARLIEHSWAELSTDDLQSQVSVAKRAAEAVDLVKPKMQSCTVRLDGELRGEQLLELRDAVERGDLGVVVRMKGIILGKNSRYLLQYINGQFSLEETEIIGNELCFIGLDLQREAILAVFGDGVCL